MGFSVPEYTSKYGLRGNCWTAKRQTREVIQEKQNTSIKQYSKYQHTFTTCLNSEFFTAVVYTLNKELTFSGDSIDEN